VLVDAGSDSGSGAGLSVPERARRRHHQGSSGPGAEETARVVVGRSKMDQALVLVRALTEVAAEVACSMFDP
jgi:hypothetical protein